MALLTFTVHGVAAPAGSKRGFYNKKAGRVIVTDDSARSRPWKAQVADAAAQALAAHPDPPPFDAALYLEIHFYVQRPKGHFGTGKNAGVVRSSAPTRPTVKPDLLKLARAVEDALTGVCYRDDSQIVSEHLFKHYTTDGARTEVYLTRVLALEEVTRNQDAA